MIRYITAMFLLSFALGPALAQSNFTLKGKLSEKANDKKIYLIYVGDEGEKLDSTMVKSGSFSFEIPLERSTVALLLLDHSGQALNDQQPKDIYRFYIQPGDASLQAGDSIASSLVTGLPIFKEMMQIEKALSKSEEGLKSLNKEFAALSAQKKADPDVVANFQDKFVTLMDTRRQLVQQFVKENPKSFISLYQLNTELINEDMNVPEVEALFLSLDKELQENAFGKSAASKIAAAKRTGIGVMATDFEEKTPEGIKMKLSSFKGQYVLIDFWASWCGPCRQENPNVVAAYDEFKGKNFTVLGVSIDQDAEAWTKAIKVDGLPWTQLRDTSGEIGQMYDVKAIPSNFLLNPEGKIIGRNLRGAALEQKLKEVL